MMWKVKDVHCIDDLLRRNMKVYHSEIIFQSMSNKRDATAKNEVEM